MTDLAKKQQRELFIEEFLRRLREAPPGERVYMVVGDLFTDAKMHGPNVADRSPGRGGRQRRR